MTHDSRNPVAPITISPSAAVVLKAAVDSSGARTVFSSAEEFSKWLITSQMISTVPWDDAGAHVRWSVTFVAGTRDEEKRIIGEVDRRLGTVKFEF